MKSRPPESDISPQPPRPEPPTDFQSLMAAPDASRDGRMLGAGLVTDRQRPARTVATDFESLRDAVDLPRRGFERRSTTDLLIDFLTPCMIFIMVTAVISFLLDVRYVYTEVQSANLRFVALCFVLGVVALNRLIARDGKEESIMYMLGLAFAIGLYTFSMTGEYGGIGSITGTSTNAPLLDTGINMAIVAFIWWLTNRLTHECCVDENPEAGDVGILTGTVRRFQQALQKRDNAGTSIFRRRQKTPVFPVAELEAVDPSAWAPEQKKVPAPAEGATKRLPKRHPGISIFYFSVPVMFVFSVGLRVIQHGGPPMVRAGHFYVGCYTVSALMLLMLSSLGGLRGYFRARRIGIPRGIGPFWIGVGTAMVAVVLVGATRLPMPRLPGLAYVAEHRTDFWSRGSTFQPMPVTATSIELLEQSRFVERVSWGVFICLAAFLAYGCLLALGGVAAAVGRRRHIFPPWVVRLFNALDRLLERITRLPSLPRFERRVRVSRNVATCTRYKNPLGDPERAQQMTTRDMIEFAYEALCALALDLGVPRREDQTPYEFVQSFPKALSSLRDEAFELTELYVQAAYSPRTFEERVQDRLRKFWLVYEKVRRHVVR